MAAKRIVLVAAIFFTSVSASPDGSNVNVSISSLPSIDVGLLHHKDVDGKVAVTNVKKSASTKKQDPYAEDAYGDAGMTGGDSGMAVSDQQGHSESGSASHAERAIEAAIASVKGPGSSEKFLAADPAKKRSDNSSDSLEASMDASKDLSTSETMEAAMTELMLGKTAFSATPMGGSITIIKKLIVDTMMPKIKSAHSGDQRMLERLSRQIKKCGSTKNDAFRGAKTQFLKYKKMSRLHKRCRADEAVRFTSKQTCMTDQVNRFKIKVLKCKAFAHVSRLLGTTKNNKEIVSKGGGESVESYIRRMSATFCGRHVHGPKGNVNKGGGWGGGLENGFLDKYLRAKESCHRATKDYINKVKECKRKSHAYNVRKAQCNQYQEQMDGSSCKRAVLVKDACESYAGCYYSRKKIYHITEAKVRFNERDRKAEWRGLKRMECLIHSFADGKVTGAEVDACKKKAHGTDHLIIKYPRTPPLVKCAIPTLYPSTGAYKRAEFASLPHLAKGKESQQCQGVQEIATTPRKGSPKGCECQRITLNGHYTPGPLVKCTKCLDVRRSRDRNSCPRGTKIFAPTSRADWKTFLSSARPLRDPNFIIDVTRPQNGCGGCTSNPMNSGNSRQKSWTTADGSPWWLRSTHYAQPSGDYAANCFMDLGKRSPRNENYISFNDARCTYHSKSYYCQPFKVHLKPKPGSPVSCKCSQVDLTGKYSAGALVRCEQCLTVYRSTQKNSCPVGMKIFSPASRRDWKTFLKSAGPLRAPHWIIDVTRPQNGCGGCKRYPMNSRVPQQATWRTSDGSPWWLRSIRYSEPNGDYSANCYMDLWKTPNSENTVMWNDGKCNYRSRSYYCQPLKRAKAKAPKPMKGPRRRRLVPWRNLKPGIVEKVFYFKQGSRCPNLKGRNPNMMRRVNKINYPRTKGKFSGFARATHFAARWDTFLIIDTPGDYTFYTGSDDGSNLYIDKKKIVNNDGLHAMRTAFGRAKLSRGQHALSAIMFQKGGHAGMRVIYKGPDTNHKNRIIGAKNNARYVPLKGFKEEVYYMKNLKNVPNLNKVAAMERIRPHVVYAETKSAWPGFRQADNFAVRWTGLLRISQGGGYRFSLLSDDGSKLFLRPAGGGWKKVVDNDGLHALRNREANFRVKGKVQLRLEYFERGGKSCMIFRYMGPDTKNRMKFVPQKVMLANV